MNIDFRYYLDVFWRRFPYFLIVFAFFTSIGVSVAVLLPPEYQASATLVVEAPQIPDALASSTVKTRPSEQLELIEQRLMTRANMLDTVNRLNVFGPSATSSRTATSIVREMRERTSFRATTGKNRATIINLSFRAPSATLASGVTNEFVTLVLQENVEMRTSVAGDTLEFFQQEVDRLSAELDAQSARILQFQNENLDALPQSADALSARRTILEERLLKLDQDKTLLEDQKVRLIEIFERTEAEEVVAQRQLSPEERALENAKEELDGALLVYSEANPRVKLLKSRIVQLEQKVAAQSETINELDEAQAKEAEEAVSLQRKSARELMDAQLAQIDRNLEFLQASRERNAAELEAAVASLSRIPENSLNLARLQRDYDNAKTQYNSAIDRLAKAETGERIELLAKGQRISVIEQATTPDSPSKPDRPKIAVAGAGVGLAMGLGLVFLLELLNRSIRRPVEITEKLGITPIAVLPYVKTDKEQTFKRLFLVGILAVFLIGIPLIMFGIHSFYTPLDELFEPIANRFGVSLSSR